MQVTSGTFQTIRPQVEHLLGREASVDNPLDNLLGGALLWRKYLDQTDGDIGAAARLYHGGENPAGHGPRTRQYGYEIQQVRCRDPRALTRGVPTVARTATQR